MRTGSILSSLLDKAPYIGELRRRIRENVRSMGRYPAGHYYSPIPGPEDVERHAARGRTGSATLPDIDLNVPGQLSLLQTYGQYYSEMPFPEEKRAPCRYYFNQKWFCYADAIFLYCHIRSTTPRRVIEVGSGFSSAVILDTAERFLPAKPAITFIEPHPERLENLLCSDDRRYTTLLTQKVQDTPMELFAALAANDLLFIDSSHVLKAGSDVHFLLFEVLPRLAPGVFVHFHDIFYPFDYPPEWLTMGRYWNEAYFLRAFLAFNNQWRVHLFNSYVGQELRQNLAAMMPLCLKDTGGSLYVVRT